jgi:hypothetical protein
MAGSDWPIAGDMPIGGMLTDAMEHARLSDDEQTAIAATNCLRLLGIGASEGSSVDISWRIDDTCAPWAHRPA